MGFGLASLGNMMGISSALSMAGSIYAANKSASSAKRINEANLNWEKAKATHAYQWLKEDLQNAGYNQALAFQNGSATPQAGSLSGLKTPDYSGFSESAKGLQNAIHKVMDYTQDLKRTNNETAETQQNIAESKSRTLKNEVETGILDKTGLQKAKAEIENLNANSAKAMADSKTLSNVIGKLTNAGYESLVKSGGIGGIIGKMISKHSPKIGNYSEREHLHNWKRNSAKNINWLDKLKNPILR